MPQSYGQGVCVSCWRTRVLRPRNLCWSCYGNRDIRALFPPRSPKGNRYGKRAKKGGGALKVLCDEVKGLNAEVVRLKKRLAEARA